MKIAILANDTTYTYNLRGALLRRLLAAGHRVTVISQLRGFCPELEAMGCTLIGIDNDRHGKIPFRTEGSCCATCPSCGRSSRRRCFPSTSSPIYLLNRD